MRHVRSEGERITGVRGDPEHPANFGRLCTKGSTLHLTAAPVVQRHARLLHPMRREQRGGRPLRVDWNEALDHAAERFAQVIRAHGPDAVGFYISGQLLTEDYYVFNKLAKGLPGHQQRGHQLAPVHEQRAVRLQDDAGRRRATPTCEDLEQADCVFIVGSNMAYAHPILFRRLERAKARGRT